MGAAAALDVAKDIKETLSRQNEVRMVFAAAPSQSEMLQALVEMRGIDWPRATAFHMDEYIGLSEADPARFAQWLHRHLFSRVPFGRVEPIVPEPDPEAAAREYARMLNERPIDIVCLGIGVNGHIAFNDPPVADLSDPEDVKIVELDAVCRQQQVDDGAFPTLDAVPTHAMTLTIPRLLSAGRLYCVVPGRNKRDAVKRALTAPVSTACPATALRMHANCTLYLDRDSAPDA
jgi:glucosamine-6-phosphate deaminase